jgi:hypothetical protein
MTLTDAGTVQREVRIDAAPRDDLPVPHRLAAVDALGPAVVDAGNPFGPSTSVGNGAADGATSGLTGYSVLNADTIAAAAELARDCPVLDTGGSVDVYETIPVM